MTNDKLSESYLEKGRLRLETLEFLHQKGGYSDVVREAQECVELLLKALLRTLGIEVPKIHDVSRTLKQNTTKLPSLIQENLDEISEISRSLRKERELSFYGSDDWIPTEEYSAEDSQVAIEKTKKIYKWVRESL